MEKPKLKFEDLLEESFQKRRKVEKGSKHTLKVTSVKSDYIFVRLESEGISGLIHSNEYDSEKIPKPGQVIQAYFIKESHGEYYFSTLIHWEDWEEEDRMIAIQCKIPFLGTLGQEEKNGGYEVRLGSQMAFLPSGQIDLQSPIVKESLNSKLRKMKFLIIEMIPKSGKVIVSSRKYIETLKKDQKQTLREEWKVGSFVSGEVSSVTKSGVRIVIDGWEAFIPASEASWKKGNDWDKDYPLGKSIRARIIELDWNSDKIILSSKEFLNDPWAGSLPFKEGDIVSGTIESIKQFGMFIRLTNDFSGLVPNKDLGSNRSGQTSKYQPGQTVEVMISEIQPAKKQIGLSITKALKSRERQDYSQYLSEETGPATSSFGAILSKALKKN
jgi:ribosomal protein S1